MANGAAATAMANATVEERLLALEAGIDSVWVLSCGILVLLMQLGFTLLECGCVQEGNVVTTYAKNLFDLLVGVLCAILFGHGLANDLAPDHVLSAPVLTVDDGLSFFLFVAYQSTSATIVSGAVAGRCSVGGYLAVSLLMMGVVYPLVVRFTWTKLLAERGLLDFAGSGVVHMTGGVAGTVCAYVLGPRKDRWDPALAGDFVPSNVPKVLEGTLLLWVCWFSFNAGSTGGMSTSGGAATAVMCAINTALAGMAGGVAAGLLTTEQFVPRLRINIVYVANGILAGLVAISAGCDATRPGHALIVGCVGGCVMVAAETASKALRIDDLVSAGAVHGAGGLWGLVAVGLFHTRNGLYDLAASTLRLPHSSSSDRLPVLQPDVRAPPCARGQGQWWRRHAAQRAGARRTLDLGGQRREHPCALASSALHRRAACG